jgi:hypothetical protein
MSHWRFLILICDSHRLFASPAHACLFALQAAAPVFNFSGPVSGACGGRVDLAVAMDRSGSITNGEFNQMREFVRALFREFPFGPDVNDSRVAIVSFSSAATANAYFSPQGTSPDSIRDIIAAIPGTGGGTDTAEALTLLRTNVFTVANGMRPAVDGVPKLAVLMSDGASNSRTAAVAAAGLLRNAGVTILALQIGSTSTSLRNELIAITGNASLVFTVTNFGDLAAAVLEITPVLCANVETTSPTTSPTTSSPTPAPTASPTTSSPTPAPTFSPTVSPTASPTSPCSVFTQTLTATETGSACVHELSASSGTSTTSGKKGTSGASTASGKKGTSGKSPTCGKGTVSFEDAFVSLWNGALVAQNVFVDAIHTLSDIVADIEVTSTYDAENTQWVHSILIVYKPESPLDQAVFGQAAADLVNAAAAELPYCSCSPVFNVVDQTRAYEMAEVETSSSSSASSSSSSKKCKGAFSPPKLSKKSTANAGVSGSSKTAVSSSSSATIAVAALVVVAGVAVLAVRQRRSARAGEAGLAAVTVSKGALAESSIV